MEYWWEVTQSSSVDVLNGNYIYKHWSSYDLAIEFALPTKQKVRPVHPLPEHCHTWTELAQQP